jgi:hypothetical membrane protein
MIGIAIQLLQLLIGVIVICAVIWFVFYVLGQVMGIAIPERLVQMVWLIVLILVLIALLSMVAGGSISSGFHFGR